MKSVLRHFVVLLSIFPALIALNGCAQRQELPVVNVRAVRSVAELSDSTFLSYVRAISFAHNKIFCSDYKNNRIVVLDSSLNVVREIGGSGRGPGEFSGASYCTIADNVLYALDDGGLRINEYSLDGRFIRSLSLRTTALTQFAVDGDGRVYLSTPRGNHPITVLDRQGAVLRSFGTWFAMPTQKEDQERNFRLLLVNADSELISISATEPIIERYTLGGRLKSVLNMSKYAPLTERISFVRGHYKADRVRGTAGYALYSLFTYAAIVNGRLFLLYIDGQPPHQMVLVVDIEGSAMRPVEVLRLQNKKGEGLAWVQPVSRWTRGKFVAFDGATGAIYAYVDPPAEEDTTASAATKTDN